VGGFAKVWACVYMCSHVWQVKGGVGKCKDGGRGDDHGRGWAGVGRCGQGCAGVGRACVHMRSHVWQVWAGAAFVAEAAGVCRGGQRWTCVCTYYMFSHALTRATVVGRFGHVQQWWQSRHEWGMDMGLGAHVCASVGMCSHVLIRVADVGRCGQVKGLWQRRQEWEVVDRVAHVCACVGMRSHALTRVAGVARELWAGAGGVSEEASVGRGG
jgi:hypothetical protein